MSDPIRQLSRTIMHGSPLFPVAAGLILGIVADRVLAPPVAWYLAPFLLATIATLIRSVRMEYGVLPVLVAGVCVGGFLHHTRVRFVPANSIERFTTDTRQIARIGGTIVSQPRTVSRSGTGARSSSHATANPFERWTYRSDRTAFLFDVESIETDHGLAPVTGRVRVTIDEAVLDLRENENVEVFGWLHPLYPQRNPGAFDWSAYLRRQGVRAQVRAPHRENVRRMASDPPPRRGFITWLRTTARRLLTDDLAPDATEEASLLEAMVLGHRSRLDRRLNDMFIRAGCIHFLAVSGVHIVIVMFFARLICRLSLGGPRTCTWAMIVAVILYATLAEPRPPILRASVIAMLYCIARLLGRQRACLNWISASAIILAFINPATIFDIGFQLSYGACIGVSYLTPALAGVAKAARHGWRKIRSAGDATGEPDPVLPASRERGFLARNAARARRATLAWALTAVAVTAGAWLATLPVVAIYFHRIHPWGAVNSILLLPFVTVVMGLGFVKLLAGVMAPDAGSLLAEPLSTADGYLIGFVEHLGRLPGSTLSTSAPPGWVILLYYASLLVVMLRFSRGSYWPWPSDPAMPHQTSNTVQSSKRITPISLAMLAVAIAGWAWPGSNGDRVTVTALSVGSGAAVVIELPDGQTILCDIGSASPYDVGRSTVVPFLRHRGITRVDRVYISHPNLDHFSGLPSLLDEIACGPVVVNEYFEPRGKPGSPSHHLLDLLRDRQHPLETQDASAARWAIGDATIERLWPPEGLDESFTVNDTSTVLRVSFASHSILLTGDIEERAQRALLETTDLQADVLLLPHHGSVRPSLSAFLKATGATSLVRSSSQGAGADTGELAALAESTPLFNTASDGAISVEMGADGLRVFPASRRFQTR